MMQIDFGRPMLRDVRLTIRVVGTTGIADHLLRTQSQKVMTT